MSFSIIKQKYIGVPVALHSKTTQTTAGSELLDTTSDFIAEGIQVGDKVFIQASFGVIPGPPATVTSVSTTSLGLTEAIAGTAGQNYFIFAGDQDPKRGVQLLPINGLLYGSAAAAGTTIFNYSLTQYSDTANIQSAGLGATYTNTGFVADAVTRHWEKLVSTNSTDVVSYMSLGDFYDSVNNEWIPTNSVLIG